MQTKTFKDLIVWQKAKKLAVLVYNLTEAFPKSEQYGLTNQMRRAAISVSSNIAESYHRLHKKEKDLLAITYGSSSELESQVEVAKELFPNRGYEEVELLVLEIQKILNTFLRRDR